jgi:ribonuclease BN (tRNA processing enzyme)
MMNTCTLRILGCSGGIASGLRTTSLLLNESILIDAGTGVGDLTLQELTKIDHVFLTHSHLDHICCAHPHHCLLEGLQCRGGDEVLQSVSKSNIQQIKWICRGEYTRIGG